MSFAWTDSAQPATGAIAVYNLWTRLSAQGWTKKMDSDGTTYSSTGVQVTSGATGAGGLNNTNAWMRLQDPGGTRELSFQRTTSSLIWRVKYSASAKFTGGSPGATQTSSATDEQLLLGSGTNAAPTGATWFGTDNTYRQHIGADSAAPYPFWMAGIPNGGGAISAAGGVLIFDPVQFAEPSDADPCVIYLGSTSNTMLVTPLYSETAQTANVCRGYLAKGLAGEGWVTIPAIGLKTASREIYPNGQGSNPHTSKDDSIPVMYARPSAIAAPTGYKGFSRMMRWNGTGRSNGDTLTVSTTRDRIMIGDVNLPWAGTVPTL